jgi:hypothetical protein
MFLGYALGKELDDLGRFDEAFHWFSEGARARRRHLSYDVATDERKIRRIVDCFPKSAPTVDTCVESSRHIFIVGLPRSGTTLLEHILTGLQGVRSNGETDNFSRALLTAAPADGGDVFARAALADPNTVAVHYARFAGADLSADRIIEKLPMNYLYLGSILRALPESKVLLVSRSPLDSCFAMYRTLFGEAYPFSYDFEELARYYAAYRRLIHHWRSIVGKHLHEVSYEDLVKEPARIGASIAQYCGLSWSASALEVQRSAAISLTASAAQIRRPIYGSSSGRWRHYRTHLAPLIMALRQSGIGVGDDT